MKAVIFHEHGGADVLQYTDVDTPQPGYGEVQVELKASAMNRLDIWVRNGWPGIRIEYPHILGADGAGVISAVGEGVMAVSIGDRVVINGTINHDPLDPMVLAGKDNLARRVAILGEDIPGTYAEYVTVPQQNVLTLPNDFPFDQAAAASLVYLTAWHSMITRGNIRAGESVLIVGAGGGVNTASIQIAKLIGVTVYVVGSNQEKCDRARDLGADFTVDRSQEENWSKAIYMLTGKRGVDAVIDNVGAGTWPMSLRSLTRGGRLLTVGGTSGYSAEVPVNLMFGKHLSIIGSTMSNQTDFRTVMKLIFEGKLHPVIDKTYSLTDIKQAHEYMDSGELFGKIVLTV